MIKNRNKIILFLVIICLLVGSFLLINNKDIKVKSVSSKSKKYEISYNEGFEKTSWCDRYYSGVGTKVFSASEVNEGFPMYVNNGCATTLEDYVKNNSNSKSDACNTTYNYLNSKTWRSEADISSYNNVCDGDLSVNLNGATCDEVKNLLKASYIEYAWYYDTFKNECKEEAKSIDINELKKGSYTSNDSCESRKYNDGFTGVLKSGESPKNYGGLSSDVNSCSYTLVYVDGYATTYDDWVDKIKDRENKDDLINSYKQIKKDWCQDERKKAEGKNDAKWYDWLNSECNGVDGYEILTLVDKVKILFDASNGYGIECKNDTQYYSDSVCVKYINKDDTSNYTLQKTNLPDTSNLKSLGTQYQFKGWKLEGKNDSSCSETVNFTADGNDKKFVPCYSVTKEDDEQKYTIYNTCGSNKSTSATFKIQGNGTGKDDVSNKAVVENSVITTHTYKSENYDFTSGNVTYGNKSFKINQFCSLGCTEEFKFYYPTTFETVKSGTYFNLLSYPEIKSSFTCVEEFKKADLDNAYENQKKNEIKAYVNWQNSMLIDDSTPSGGCDDEGNNCRYFVGINALQYNEGNITYASRNETGTTPDSAKSNLRYSILGNSTTPTNKYKGVYDSEKGNTYNLVEAVKVCSEVLRKDTTDTNTFYNIDNAEISFYYESYDTSNNDENINGTDYEKDTLNGSKVYTNDVLVTNDDDANKVTFVDTEYKVSYDNNKINRNLGSIEVPTATLFKRVVNRNIIYSHSTSHKEYYADILTGKISTSSNNDNSMYLGYVYPVRLNLSGNKNVYFKINANTNLGWGASEVLKDSSNLYKCDYDIANDIVIKDSKSEDKYKKNFYIRSVSTSDVDPNNRLGTGKFGTNWDNDKGTKLIDIIQNKSKNNNTYNPSNLEYSFTLNANTIDAIKAYNYSQKNNGNYLAGKLKCNNFNGECKSKFIEDLLNNKIDGTIVNNVNAKVNRKWKYFIGGEWYYNTKGLLSITSWKKYNDNSTVNSNILNNCNCYDNGNDDAKTCYDCIYRNINEGVLP